MLTDNAASDNPTRIRIAFGVNIVRYMRMSFRSTMGPVRINVICAGSGMIPRKDAAMNASASEHRFSRMAMSIITNDGSMGVADSACRNCRSSSVCANAANAAPIIK